MEVKKDASTKYKIQFLSQIGSQERRFQFLIEKNYQFYYF